jgi:stringent starvation protein B
LTERFGAVERQDMDKRAPEKKQRLLAALEQGMTMIHLDARRPGVLVPEHLKTNPHLLLNLSYRFDPPDLAVNDWGVRSTLTFGGQRFTIGVPWSALYAITSHVSREFWMYPDDMPAELIEQAKLTSKVPLEPLESADAPTAKAPVVLREVVLEKGDDPDDAPTDPQRPSDPDSSGPRPISRGHLRLVK